MGMDFQCLNTYKQLYCNGLLRCNKWGKEGCLTTYPVNKVGNHQAITFKSPNSESHGNSRNRNRRCLHLAVTCCSFSQQCMLRWGWGSTGHSPDPWFSNEIRLLHLYTKVLNSLTWDDSFSLNNCNLLEVQLPGLCCKAPTYPWLLQITLRLAFQSSLSELSKVLCLIFKSAVLSIK